MKAIINYNEGVKKQHVLIYNADGELTKEFSCTTPELKARLTNFRLLYNNDFEVETKNLPQNIIELIKEN